jgi:hypothetical protein
VLSAALRTEEFTTLLAASRLETEIGIDELRSALDALGKMVGHRAPERKIFAAANKVLYRSVGVEVHSLSPSERTLTRALMELGELLPREHRTRRRIASHRANQTAVVLWIKLEELKLNVLLGSDLENSSDPSAGWTAILQSNQRPSGVASVFKVAHHGAINADHPSVWNQMLTSNVCAVLTPFRSGDVLLPTTEDRARIVQRAKECYWTAPHNLPKPRLNRTVESVTRRMTKQLWRVSGPMGQIRVRVAKGSHRTVELFGRARPLTIKASKQRKKTAL